MTDVSRSRSNWVLLGFLAIAGFFLLTEHRAHLFGWLPFLFLLACPLLHLGHRGHGHSEHDSAAERKPGWRSQQGAPSHEHGSRARPEDIR